MDVVGGFVVEVVDVRRVVVGGLEPLSPPGAPLQENCEQELKLCS